jgi:hypothetical protein
MEYSFIDIPELCPLEDVGEEEGGGAAGPRCGLPPPPMPAVAGVVQDPQALYAQYQAHLHGGPPQAGWQQGPPPPQQQQ